MSEALGLATEALHWSSQMRVLMGACPPSAPVTSTGPGAHVQPKASVPPALAQGPPSAFSRALPSIVKTQKFDTAAPAPGLHVACHGSGIGACSRPGVLTGRRGRPGSGAHRTSFGNSRSDQGQHWREQGPGKRALPTWLGQCRPQCQCLLQRQVCLPGSGRWAHKSPAHCTVRQG